jgi:hypothetical protein
MKRNTLLFAACAYVVLAGLCASTSPVLAQEGTRGDVSGHVTMRVGRGALIISATGGDGELTFEGLSHKFKLGGMGIGLIGFTTVDAEGDVFNLKKIEDFPGAYVQGGADYAAGDGQGVLWLTNAKGVVMKLRSKTKGVSLAVGGEGLLVQMGDIKK